MDSITHILAGGITGYLAGGKKLGKKSIFLGAAFNSLPDIDVVADIFLNEPQSMLVHRGLTHSLFFALLAPIIFALLLKNRFKVSFKFLYLFILLQLGIHDFIDACTVYGTGLLEPFSDIRFSLNNLFVIDPFFSFPLILSFVVLLLRRFSDKIKRVVVYVTLAATLIYFSVTIFFKMQATKTIQDELHRQTIDYSSLITTPTPFNSLLWMALAKNDTGTYVGYYSVFDSVKSVPFYFVNKNDDMYTVKNDELAILKKFSLGFYSTEKKDSLFYFNDLRFGQFSGWDNPHVPYAFSYRINGTEPKERAFNRSRIKGTFGENMKSLLKRVVGL